MTSDYTFIYAEYPEVISAEQLYRICHISKRKAKWLLENGCIPCQDTRKKTHRYKIHINDVVTYLQAMETAPETVFAPVGLFNSKSRRINPITMINIRGFQQFLYKVWSKEPDALTMKDVQILTGYSRRTIGQWIVQSKLRNVMLPNRTQIIAKRWLIEFISEYTVQNPSRLSNINRQIAEQYMEQ
ncbi:DNA-binding protein [Intestinimonas butyriciproducens]|uniref:DNA-binding protein n=1 Tax=Intestinimonas butyriciproducens TaxID=1297617 RepID=UPI001D06368E|nr:DNA-binding protein [Intestinimonas butyriciproducens]MCB7051100.1 DNA-binding protein [Intestinimonas butyriciproducens]